MNSPFRLVLRGGFFLLVIAGVGLIVYAAVSDSRGQRLQPADEAVPQTEPDAEAARQEEEPIAPATAPVEQELASEPVDEGKIPPATVAGGDTQSVLDGFTSVFHDHERDREEATLRGDRAVELPGKIYDVFAPRLLVYVWGSEGKSLDDEFEERRGVAERAKLDEDHRTVYLSDNVRAKGEDLEIRADSVVYHVSDRTLASETLVRIRKDKTDDDGTPVPAMLVSGRGLRADLTVRRMSILQDVEARLYGVSDFLAAGTPEPADQAAARDIIITSDGKMTYEHLARTVKFQQNAKVVSGENTLTCDELTILLGKAEGEDAVQVSDILATGNVGLGYRDQVSRGDKLKWQNVTQTGTLSGEPATLTTAEFEMKGEQLTFYRVSEWFQAEGAGELLWAAADAEKPETEQAPDDRGWNFGPLQLRKDAPVLVTWHDSMTYHVADRKAHFEGQVTAQQGNSSLDCENLELTFEPDTDQMREVQAAGDVGIHDRFSGEARDVTCHKLVWDTAKNVVQLMAKEGDTVSVTVGENAITSEHVVLDNVQETLECPVAGRLTVRPSEEGGKPSPRPIDVQWQEAMHFARHPEPVARFTGSCVAHRGEETVSSQALRVSFDADMMPLKIVASDDALVDVRSRSTSSAGAPATGGAEAAEPAEVASVPGLPPVRGSRWRLSGDELTITPPEDLIAAAGPGTLTVLEGDITTGAIDWQKSMQMDSAANVAEFQGSAKADISGTTLQSDTLKLDFDDQNNLRHIWAEGQVHFAHQGEGESPPLNLAGDTIEAVFGAASVLRQVIARENVQFQYGDWTLKSRVLRLSFDKEQGQEKLSLQRAVAEREVRVNYHGEGGVNAGGDRLEWDKASDRYVLTGDPDAYLRQGQVQTMTNKILLDRPTGKVEFPPDARPVRTVFVRDAE
ncbi:MAG: LptA/OstA family protein [Planctomycetota bacterium]|jgi:lipopolysaccharide export system protein LptA